MIAAVILTALAGTLHGLREAFHADRRIFEDWLKVQPVSFLGSKQDELKYNSIGEFKSVWWKYFPFDFWHLSRWLGNGAIAGAIWMLTGVWYFAPAYIILIASGGHLSYWIARKNTSK